MQKFSGNQRFIHDTLKVQSKSAQTLKKLIIETHLCVINIIFNFIRTFFKV